MKTNEINKWLEREWTTANEELESYLRIEEKGNDDALVSIERSYWAGYLDAITNTQNELTGMSEE